MDLKHKKETMRNKKEVKKYDGFAVASFALSLIPFVFVLSLMIDSFFYLEMNPISLFFFMFPLAVAFPAVAFLICGIIALKRIRKNKNLKGRALAITAIVISSLVIYIYVLGYSGLFLLIGGL